MRRIEARIMGVTCGFQDQHMAVFGGLNYMDFAGKETLLQKEDEPLATIEPTAIQLGMPVDTDFGYSNIDGLEVELIQQKYQNALIFVAWEHNELVKLVRQLVRKFDGDPNQVPNWHGNDFDSLYVVRITGPGPTRSVSFAQDHEGLSNLSNDCP